MLPLSYSIRNLMRSIPRTVQMVLGATLVVVLVITAEAFNRGMNRALSATGDPDNVLLVGAGSEESLERSQVSAVTPGIVSAALSGVRSKLGQQYVSPQVHHGGLLAVGPDNDDYEIMFRGITPTALMVHPQVEIVDGAFPGPGEVMVGRQAHRFVGTDASEFAIGKTITFDSTPLTISGIFQAPGTMMESEIWLNAQDLMDLTNRKTYSCIVVTMDDAEFEDIDYFCKQRLDLELTAIPEASFYRQKSLFFKPIKYMIWLTALLITMGAVFGGLNTMYAAYISRRKEMATLQAIGYSRKAIYFSLLQESLIANILGTLAAVALALFALDGLAVSFATGVFHLHYDLDVLVLAIVTGLGLGVFGTIVPAWNSLKPPLVSSLRV